MKLQANIAEEFNEFSKNYTDDMVKLVPHYLQLLEQFSKDLTSDFKPKNILDFGCGNGTITSKLLPIFPDTHYTLLDASGKMLALCESQFGLKHKTYVQSYFQDYKFTEEQFDMVVAGFSLHHCIAKEKQELFKNIYKSLNKKGIFACSDLMIDRKAKEHNSFLNFWRDFVIKNPSDTENWDWLMEHYQAYDHPESLNQQLKYLKGAGFAEFKITIYNTYWVHLKAFKN